MGCGTRGYLLLLLELSCHANLFSLVSPFGKLEKVRKDLVEPALGEKFWDWSLQQVKPYM